MTTTTPPPSIAAVQTQPAAASIKPLPMSDADYAAAQTAANTAKSASDMARTVFEMFHADFCTRAKQHESLQKDANDKTAATQKLLQPLAVETARRLGLEKKAADAAKTIPKAVVPSSIIKTSTPLPPAK